MEQPIPRLSGTPAEAGVRGGMWNYAVNPFTSQWNPRRSRGARRTVKHIRRDQQVSVEPPPKQGCEYSDFVMMMELGSVSVEPPPKQGCEAAGMEWCH